jgi:hypothetical protein
MAVIGFFVTVCLGLFFYWLRCRWQLVYGLVELVVALAVIILTFYPQNNYLSSVGGPSLVGLVPVLRCRYERWDLRDGARARQHPQWIAAEMALQVGTYIPRVLCVAHKGHPNNDAGFQILNRQNDGG